MSLPRTKLLSVETTVCADCSTEDPQWASLNRGVLLCSECCSIHRSLGRHISQVRSLKKGMWHISQLALVHTLYSNGANNIWEHSLLDPQSLSKTRLKPTSKDPVHPVKSDFIRAKYANLSFALRPSKDDGPLNLADLNRQLWSCVRTAHVETTLRLMALGADPNYVDPDKGTTPLHVAAKEGQSLQVELLCIYGADAAQPDKGNLTPADVSRLENYPELSIRLLELRFDVTNRLTMFLCGRKPDHSRGQNFLIPEMTGDASNDKLSKTACRALQLMPHLSFERLLQDVYDEVDRRETDSAWLSSIHGFVSEHNINERLIVPFLPVNQELSPMRNQSRQKLAKFNARQFANLIIDALNEARRLYLGQPVTVVDDRKSVQGNASEISADRCMSGDSREYDYVPDDKRRESCERLKDRLADLQNAVEDAGRSNRQLLGQMNQLQATVDRLAEDNVQLRIELQMAITNKSPLVSPILPSKSLPIVQNQEYAINGSKKESSPIEGANGSAFDKTRWSFAYPDNLIIETEQLTLAIRKLLSDAQQSRLPATALAHASNIESVVERIGALVPCAVPDSAACIRAMTDACLLLTARCNAVCLDVDQTCQAAYLVAKSAKQLLVIIQE